LKYTFILKYLSCRYTYDDLADFWGYISRTVSD